jgi:hypothetical protein
VLAGLEREPRVLVMVRVRRADVHGVDGRIGDELAVAAVRLRVRGGTDLGEEGACAGRIAAAGGRGDDGVVDVGRGAGGGRGEDVLGEDCLGLAEVCGLVGWLAVGDAAAAWVRLAD